MFSKMYEYGPLKPTGRHARPFLEFNTATEGFLKIDRRQGQISEGWVIS